MVYTFQGVKLFFSNLKPACSSIWTLRLRAHIGKDRKEEKPDSFQYLTNPDQRDDVLRDILPNPNGSHVLLWVLHGHGDDTEEGFLKILIYLKLNSVLRLFLLDILTSLPVMPFSQRFV